MTSRREPLLWLQCLAIGLIPLELLLIRMVLAAADPGPIPPIERLFTWGVGVLAPAIALWKRPADWGSLLVLRLPTGNRSTEQQQLSARQAGPASAVSVALAAALLLPAIWFLDDSAGLIHEFSPLQGSSRLLTLVLCMPLLAVIVWQIQQLVQAMILLINAGGREPQPFEVEQLRMERTSFGLQLLKLSPLEWPEPAAVAPSPSSEVDQTKAADHSQDESSSVNHPPAEPEQPEEPNQPEEPEQPAEPDLGSEAEAEFSPPATTETDAPSSSVNAAGAGPAAIEPEQSSEEDQSSSLDTEIGEIDGDTGGSAESHREQAETSGGEQGEPESTSETTPGSL